MYIKLQSMKIARIHKREVKKWSIFPFPMNSSIEYISNLNVDKCEISICYFAWVSHSNNPDCFVHFLSWWRSYKDPSNELIDIDKFKSHN